MHCKNCCYVEDLILSLSRSEPTPLLPTIICPSIDELELQQKVNEKIEADIEKRLEHWKKAQKGNARTQYDSSSDIYRIKKENIVKFVKTENADVATEHGIFLQELVGVLNRWAKFRKITDIEQIVRDDIKELKKKKIDLKTLESNLDYLEVEMLYHSVISRMAANITNFPDEKKSKFLQDVLSVIQRIPSKFNAIEDLDNISVEDVDDNVIKFVNRSGKDGEIIERMRVKLVVEGDEAAESEIREKCEGMKAKHKRWLRYHKCNRAVERQEYIDTTYKGELKNEGELEALNDRVTNYQGEFMDGGDFEGLYGVALKISNKVKEKIPHQGNTIQGALYTGFESVYRNYLVKDVNMDKIEKLGAEFTDVIESNAVPKGNKWLQEGGLMEVLQGIESDWMKGATCGNFATSALLEALQSDSKEEFRVWISKPPPPEEGHVVLKINTKDSAAGDIGLIVDLLAHVPYPVLECNYTLFDLTKNILVPPEGILCGGGNTEKNSQFVEALKEKLTDSSFRDDQNLEPSLDWTDDEIVEIYRRKLRCGEVEEEEIDETKKRMKKKIFMKYWGPLNQLSNKKSLKIIDDVLGPEYPQLEFYGELHLSEEHAARQVAWGAKATKTIYDDWLIRKIRLAVKSVYEDIVKRGKATDYSTLYE